MSIGKTTHSRLPADFFKCGTVGKKTSQPSLRLGTPDLKAYPMYRNGWSCDKCHTSYSVFTERWFNPMCTVDFCFKCKPRLWYCCKKFTPRAGPGNQHYPVAAAIVPGMPVFATALVKFGPDMPFAQMDNWVCLQNGVPHGTFQPAVIGWVPLLEGLEPVLSTVEPTYRVPSFRSAASRAPLTGPSFQESETGHVLPIVLSSKQKALQQTAVLRSLQNSVAGTGYQAYGVSWDDASRGVVNGCLSAYGTNITDTTLCTRSGHKLYMIRPENFNERLGKIRARDLRVLVGNHVPNAKDADLASTSLSEYLACIGVFGGYVGLQSSKDLSAKHLDDFVSVRFQTVFIPMTTADTEGPVEEFCAQSYSYNTRDADNPKNIMLLCSSQGTAVMQNLPGKQRLMHHVNTVGQVKNAWLSARPTRFEVAEAQEETAVERATAMAAGKACARALGFKAMGLSMNTVMTVQIPLMQRTVPSGFNSWSKVSTGLGSTGPAHKTYINECAGPKEEAAVGGLFKSMIGSASSFSSDGGCPVYRSAPSMKRGRSSVARVSIGTVAGEAAKLVQRNPQRHKHEHITVTIIRYHAVEGGVPTPEDAKRATVEMDQFYAVLNVGKLSDIAFDFVKTDMSAKEVAQVAAHTPATNEVAHAPAQKKSVPCGRV